ncbi:hypothetical protein [Roseobacter sp. S98]|uniref:hypothetical protein n=1 Tax=Roseobacter algicola (ex Choi et al. 2025) (nom. illeg.) TaxID=3092138 RepID=UPI003F50D599
MKECDLVMKGGTTSGVVYPFAITEISKEYRFRSIAGTSAGAIAATLTAAAEYRRQMALTPDVANAGFDAIEEIAEELADDMMSMLQPSEAMAPLFNAFDKFLEEEKEAHPEQRTSLERAKGPLTVLFGQWKRPNRVKTARLGLEGGLVKAGFSVPLIGSALVGIAGFPRWKKIFQEVLEQLEKNDYGVLPGTTQDHFPNQGKQGVIDWLADHIDKVAGHWTEDGAPTTPLRIGDLNGNLAPGQPDTGITLATITTDLNSQRPYRLPLNYENLYYFNPEEMEKVLPKRVVDYMVSVTAAGKKETIHDGKTLALFPVPVGDDFPVILVARLSLSFPLLIQAVPLWRQDHLPFAGEGKTNPWIRCLFSDGGISSNLPVHLFDSWLPRRPTFAISLGSHDDARHGKNNRVHFSNKARHPTDFDAIKIGGLVSFLMSILTGAKDWQDKLQAQLPGFAERVATVRLKDNEGGQNLKMEKEVIKALQSHGRDAGQQIVGNFNFEENRWKRALSILPQFDMSIKLLEKAYSEPLENPNGSTYRQIFLNANYPGVSGWSQTELVPYVDSIAALAPGAPNWTAHGVQPVDAVLRLVSNVDLSG